MLGSLLGPPSVEKSLVQAHHGSPAGREAYPRSPLPLIGSLEL